MLFRAYLFPVVLFVSLSVLSILLYSWNGGLSQIQRQICSEVPLWDARPISRRFRPIRSLEKDSDNLNSTFASQLLPRNGGLLRVRLSGEQNTITDYGISMFHQLHCLATIRELAFPNNSLGHGKQSSQHGRVHLAHCFDYLAQVCLVYIWSSRCLTPLDTKR